jgi:hypothetical protein
MFGDGRRLSPPAVPRVTGLLHLKVDVALE